MSSSSSSNFQIAQQPSSNTVLAGQAYTSLFSVAVSSPFPVTYRWQHSVNGGATYFDINPDGGVFTGARTSTLGVYSGMTDLTSVWNGAKFRCIVESNGQTLVSDAGTLTVVTQLPASSSSSSSLQTSSSSATNPPGDTTCGGVIECGGTMRYADCGLLPMPGHEQYMDCELCECVAVALTTSSSSQGQAQGLSSSSSEDYETFEYTGFLEIRVQRVPMSSSSSQEGLDGQSKSSSDSSELMTMINKDPQNLVRLQTIDQQEDLTTCYYFSFEEQCPQGYQFEAFDTDCESPPCDKICCPEDRSGYDAMICARVYSGAEDHNRPWQFHFEPNSLFLQLRREVAPGSLVDTLPSEIDRLLADGSIDEGTICCFAAKGATRDMSLTGVGYCIDPLQLNAVRVFDDNLGEFVQETSCEGDCELISGTVCLDGYGDDVFDNLSSELQDLEQQVENMTEEQGVQFHVESLEGADYSEAFLYHMLEFDDLDQGFASFSSSSSYDEMDVSRISFDYNNNPVSTDPSAPYNLYVAGGVNYVFSIVGGDSVNNYFKFNIPHGYSLSELDLFPSVGPWSGAVSIQSGSIWDGLSVLEDVSFTLGNLAFMESSLPLGQGEYVLKVSSPGSEFKYTLSITVSYSGGA